MPSTSVVTLFCSGLPSVPFCEPVRVFASALLAHILFASVFATVSAPANAQSGAEAATLGSLPGETVLKDVVVTADRTAQRRFDAAASIDSVQVDPMRVSSPLVNISELLTGVPGLQVRERQNYAQDLQISVRGFGTRSSFGVRGVRILIDGIPATNPDGQGQAATASLTSAKRIEVLRGPVAQLYGNAAGGVLQVFTADPPRSGAAPQATLGLGVGSDHQRTANVNLAFGGDTLGGLVDVADYRTDGYRDHSNARRTQLNAKVVARPSSATTLTGIFNVFDQPLALDPLGLSRQQFEANPRQAVDNARVFDTRKTVDQHQAGLVLEHVASPTNSFSARLYGGQREVFQTLGFSGAAPTASGGVVDLDSTYGGAGMAWTHRTALGTLPLKWTLGVDADQLRQQRKGFVNNNGTPGAARRDERNRAANVDVFGQFDLAFSPNWNLTAGLRNSRVRFAVDDRFITSSSPDDSGKVVFRNTSPVLGLIWHATSDINVYGNLGRGFETPTLAETAYRAGATGPNLSLKPSRSVQGEIGMKVRRGIHSIDLALFQARSKDEIVPLTVENGRSIFQNVDGVQRRGVEASWNAALERLTTQISYTLLDARFRRAFVNGASTTIDAGNRLPGVPRHSLFAQAAYRPIDPMTLTLEMRAESRVAVNDVNGENAPGYAVVNAAASYAFAAGPAQMFLFARLDNLLDKRYAGSIIVNDGNGRFYEPAAQRRGFVGLRTQF
ncbi:MAG: TonB-dependent receptor [Pseudomonadota bacterium]